ncbi:MAG: carboxypeptidase-like regulatory domain-containing protein, partial [Bacteroidota bacterium]
MKQPLYLFFFLFFTFLSFKANSQFIVNGTVIDSATREALPGASVFCQNTTLGTATNKQGEFSLQLKSGGYDLIISYTGYLTQQIRINGTENNKLEVSLVKEEKSLSEVVIKSNNEVADGWEKYGDFFTKNFIGTTPNANQCSLLNPDVLKFYYYKRSNKLKVLATEPVHISNKALGYELHYLLDSFVYYYNSDIYTYTGFNLFAEMEGSDSLKKAWTVNRNKAYYGSQLHFMRSYYDSTLAEDGWMIDMIDETSTSKFNKVTDPYDTLYYGALDSTMQIEIWYPRKLSITYTKKKPEPEYLKKFGFPKNVSTQISYIDMKDA